MRGLQRLLWVLFFGFFCVFGMACSDDFNDEEPPFPHPYYFSHTEPSSLGSYDRSTYIRIGSMNAQILGPTKQGRPNTFTVLASVATNFDILAIQEVGSNGNPTESTASNVMVAFTARVNQLVAANDLQAELGTYAHIRGHQYAYVYRTDAFAVTGAQLYTKVNPSTGRAYVRYPPHIAKFTSIAAPKFRFVLLNVHTSPSEVREVRDGINVRLLTAREHNTEQVLAIPKILQEMAAHYGEKRVAALGDFNADGSYYIAGTVEQGWLNGFSPPSWFTVIPNGTKTNVARNSHWAYDRIQLSAALARYYTGTWGVIRWAEYTDVTICEGAATTQFTERALSDHYPVWAEFRIPR